MSNKFIHIGIFNVKIESREQFIKIMRDYKKTACQPGLDHSHLIELTNKPCNFRYITIWKSKEDWLTVEKMPEHLSMHKKRDVLLNADTVSNIGEVII